MGKDLKVKPLQIDGDDYVMVCGMWEGGASSATTKTTGQGWSIATGAGSGVYTITFDTEYTIANLISYSATFAGNTVADVDALVAVIDYDGSSGNNMLFTVSDGGTPHDLAADEYMYFTAIFAVSTLAVNRPRK